jgi:protein N-terminal methyltransferase
MGRISKGLLLPLFGKVDLVEASSVQLEKAKSDLQSHANIGRFINSGLESFPPDKEYYDCIWIQWVVGYLPDDDLVDFLIRCKLALKPLKSSVIILKENVTRDARYFLDTEDNNVIRSNSQFLSIFSRAGLVLTTSKYQREFPKELFPVCMYVLSPPAQ